MRLCTYSMRVSSPAPSKNAVIWILMSHLKLCLRKAWSCMKRIKIIRENGFIQKKWNTVLMVSLLKNQIALPLLPGGLRKCPSLEKTLSG